MLCESGAHEKYNGDPCSNNLDVNRTFATGWWRARKRDSGDDGGDPFGALELVGESGTLNVAGSVGSPRSIRKMSRRVHIHYYYDETKFGI
jgi:hypothetical protein